MKTKFIRQDFDFSRDSHPGDRGSDHDWAMLTMAIFRKRATHQTLGRDFLRIAYDDESPSHLIVHFADKPGVNLVTLSSAVDRLRSACTNEARDEIDAFHRRGLAHVLRTEHFSLADARRFPGLGRVTGSEAAVPGEEGDVAARHALLSWMRDTTWRWHSDGFVRYVQWVNHPNSKVSAVASCGFSAPYRNGDLGPLELLIASYQRALGMELDRLSQGQVTSNQPTPWP